MAACKNCPWVGGRAYSRGLCRRCFNTPAVLVLYPDGRARPRESATPRCATPGCPYASRRGCRGLCTRCHADESKRAARPNGNYKSAAGSPAARNRVLSDPALCPPKYLWFFAARVLKRFDHPPGVDAADLVQEGWLVLIRAAGVWTPDGPAATLPVFARKALWGRMTRVCRREMTAADFHPLPALTEPAEPG